ncbi:MAG: phosphotransferase family protein [bacterium]|nr:phosphotransferase family protein [bacterium]
MNTDKIATSLREYLSAKYPDRKNTVVYDVQSIADGWETEVFTFALSFEEDEKAVSRHDILRVYPGGNASEKAAREFGVMHTLFGTGYPVPEVYLVETDAATLGAPFVVMRKIDGRPLGSDMYPQQSENWQAYLTQFCEMLADLHKLDPAQFDIFPEDLTGEYSGTAVRGWLAGAEKSIGEFGLPGFDPVLDWLGERISGIEWGPLSLIHYDYHPYNILVDRRDDMYVIDWTCVEVTDYRVDLAWTLLLVSGYGQPDMRDIVLAEYERVVGHPVDQMEYFEVMAIARRLFSIVVTLGAGADKMGMRDGAAEMIRSNMGHVEYIYRLLQDLTGVKIAEVEEVL